MEATPAPIACTRCGASFDRTLGLRFCGTCGAELPLHDAPPEASEEERDPLLGTIFDGRYKILEMIGQGGMGKVYLVEHQQMGKRMAMKVLHRELANNKDVNRRFRREALAVSRLTSLHTVQVFDFGQGAQGMYLVMELLRGEDLGRLLEREGKLSLPRAVELLCQAATALEEAHAQGIVHRDLKPENLFLATSPQGGDLLKVLDFGLAKLQSGANEETGHGRILGTPYYMAPEQIRGGEVDHRTDVYALGALLYKLLTGDPPYRADNPFSVLSKHVSDPIPKLRDRVPSLPREADALLAALLAKEPGQRPRDVREVRRRLRGLLNEPSGGKDAADTLPPLVETAPSMGAVPTPAEVDADWATRTDWDDFVRRRRRRGRVVWTVLLLAVVVGAFWGGRALLSSAGSANPDEPGGDPEPNNDYKTALKIKPGEVRRGYLGKRINQDTPDRDLYKIEFPNEAPRWVEAELSGIPNLNVRLDFYAIRNGAAERLEPIGDRAGRGEGETLGVNTSEKVLYVAIRQVKLGDVVLENVSDQYELRVRSEAPRQAPASQPDPFTSPRRINSEQTVTGYIGAEFTQDVYRLTTPGKRLSVELAPIAGVDAVLEVYSAERQKIASADKGALSQGEQLLSIDIPEGEPPFLVVVKKSGQVEGVEYTLSAAVK